MPDYRNSAIAKLCGWLASHSNGEVVTFSFNSLAEATGATRSSLHRALQRLQLIPGLIETLPRAPTGCPGGPTSCVRVLDQERLGRTAILSRSVSTDRPDRPARTSSSSGTGTRGLGQFRWNLEPRDLVSGEAIRLAFDRTVAAGLIERSEAALLRFAAACARATRVKARNACAFVASFVRGRTPWRYLAAVDEDLARRMLAVGTRFCEAVRNVVDRLAGMFVTKEKQPMKQVDQMEPADMGRAIYSMMMDGKTLSKAAQELGVPLDRAITETRRYADTTPERTANLNRWLGDKTKPRPDRLRE